MPSGGNSTISPRPGSRANACAGSDGYRIDLESDFRVGYSFCVPEDIDTLYKAYTTDPTPVTLNRVVAAADPMIRYSLSSVNGLENPQLRGRAKLFAAAAIKNYDPTRGTALRTHIGNNLMQMRRAAREVANPVKVPERAQLDMSYLRRKEIEFQERFGRDPDTVELADYARMNAKKIAQLRKSTRPVVSESAIGNAADGEMPVYMEEAIDYVYGSADHITRKLMEMKGGYGGHEILPANVIAKKLSLDPSYISRRSAAISALISETTSMLESARK